MPGWVVPGWMLRTNDGGQVLRGRVITATTAVVALVSAALPLLIWVDLRAIGIPMAWDGLWGYHGVAAEHYGPLLGGGRPLGWVILTASVTAAVSLGISLFNGWWLRIVAVVAAAVAAVTAVLCLADPGLLLGDFKEQLGVEPASDRALTNVTALVAQTVAASVVLIGAVVSLVLGNRGQAAGIREG